MSDSGYLQSIPVIYTLDLTAPAPKTQGTLRERCIKMMRVREAGCLLRLCLLEMSGIYTHEVSTTWLPTQA